MENNNHSKQNNFSVNLGLGVNILLALLKTSVGILGSSPALLADGINSTSDVVYYFVISFFVRAAEKPADDEHPYGHTQYESVGALVISAFVITTAVTIFWNSIDTLVQLLQGKSNFTGSSLLALWVALGTVLTKIVLYIVTSRIGKRTHNETVVALASDHRNDILAAGAAALGIFLGRLGYLWVDPLAGAVVAFFILRTGLSILRETTANLMDTVPGQSLNDQIRDLVLSVQGVKDVDHVLAHRFGQSYVINLTVSVDGSISVQSGDQIANLVENKIMENIDDVRAVHVYYH
jgi:cation diffusion facilitator family transporter